MEWNHLSISKFQRLRRRRLKMQKQFHTIFYNGFNYLSTLGLKLNHVSKRDPGICVRACVQDVVYYLLYLDYLITTTCELTQYGPVTMIVPASGHQVRCIPRVQMGTFNKEIGFLYGLKFFALNIFCGEYLQSSLHIWCCKYGENCYGERCVNK